MNLVIAEKCPYCSKFRHPKEIMPLGTGGAKICWHCYGWHQAAVRVLSGQPPPGCQECGVTFRALSDAAGGGDIRMYIHAKDGIYQVLCKACSDRYVVRRVDLYGATEFGRRLNLA